MVLSKKKKTIFSLIFIAIFLLSIPYFKVKSSENNYATVIGVLNNQEIKLRVSDASSLREKGLSGTIPVIKKSYGSTSKLKPTLGTKEGMLFVFPDKGIHPFWMKDMLFSIDILWIDMATEKKGYIVHIERNVSPQSYPNTYTSLRNADRVIEIPSYTTIKKTYSIGDSVHIKNSR